MEDLEPLTPSDRTGLVLGLVALGAGAIAVGVPATILVFGQLSVPRLVSPDQVWWSNFGGMFAGMAAMVLGTIGRDFGEGHRSAWTLGATAQALGFVGSVIAGTLFVRRWRW